MPTDYIATWLGDWSAEVNLPSTALKTAIVIIMAVIRGLERLKEPCRVELYSDSKYVLDALEKGWAVSWQRRGWIKSDKKPALNPDLWARLLELAQIHELNCHWVKGHADNPKNNRCDALAVAEWKKQKGE